MFNLTQVGMTTFVYSPQKKKYVGRPFNINLFRRSIIDENRTDNMFNLNGDTIVFLRKHHFDFNHSMRSGLSYYQLAKKGELERKCKQAICKQYQYLRESDSFKTASYMGN